MANANDLRKGMCIRYNSNPAIVLEVMHRTPGNLRAFVQVIIRYIGTGKSADIRFGSTDKVDQIDVERKKLDFSYKDHGGYQFMDPESFETITFDESFVGGAKDYLSENQRVEVLYVEGKAASIELPSTVFPVSNTAGFCTLFALSPFTPSADSVTVRKTVEGSSMLAALPSTYSTSTR